MTRSPAVWALVTAVLLAGPQPQAPRFRTGTDLIVVDVQVVDSKGQPLVGLTPEKFEVSVGGKMRRIVSAELVSYGMTGAGKPAGSNPAPGPEVTTRNLAAGQGRLIVLAVDARSFGPGSSDGVLAAAQGFLKQLQPNDQVGLLSYPIGPQLDPTTDRAAVIDKLKTIAGQRQLPVVRFNLRPSEIIMLSRKIEALENYPPQLMLREVDLQPILQKICPALNGPFISQEECFRALAADVRGQIIHFEQEASQSLATLRSLLASMARVDGRKILVLLSGGLFVSDQSSARPSVGNMAVIMSQEAARANTVIYTLFVDYKYLEQFSASKATLSGTLQNLARDTSANSQWLDEFSTTAGGKMFAISAGSGDFAFARILSETSAHYLLGVEPEPADREGRPLPLTVKVKQRGANVRARTWVELPKERVAAAGVAAATVPPAPAPPVSSEATPAPIPSAIRSSAAPIAVAPARIAAPPPSAEMSAALRTLLGATADYVRRFDTAFVNVVSEERYVQDATPGAEGAPVVRHRELLSDFLLVTLPGTADWVPFRDVFEVNGAPIRDRDDRLTKLFLRPTGASIAQARAILLESATHNIGIDRNMNYPVLGLEVFRAGTQSRFRFSGGAIDPAASSPAYLVEFDEFVLPAMISGTGGRDLLMRGRAWLDATNGAIMKTELEIDDTTMRVELVTRYAFSPALKIAIPVEMTDEYIERNGRRSSGTATYGRFRKFGVETSEVVPQPR